MGNIESDEEETLPELKQMKLILDKGLYKVYENPENNKKYDFWFQKSSDHTFEEEMKIAQEIKNGNLIGITKIHNIQIHVREKLFTKYYCLNILTEHPSYTLKEYLQKKAKNQLLTPNQITDLFVSITNAQYMLGSQKQYLGFENIYTSDGTIWKIKPFIQTISFYQELLQYKSKNLSSFEMSGFPSPEEFHQSNCDTDRVKIFGLGMLLLELITKKKSKDIYKKFYIDEVLLQERITFLKAQKQNYSGRLIEIVIDILDLDLVRRPNYHQLQKYLNSPESNIDSDLKDIQVQPIDKIKSVNLNSLLPPDTQYLDKSLALQFSKIEQKLNYKMNDHKINISQSAKQPKQNLVTQNFNYYGAQINGKYHGLGKLYTKSNILVYEGDFFEGNYHNFGTLKYLDSILLKENFNYQDCTNMEKYALCYEGSFQNGIKHGEGRMTLSNGEVFAGSFVNNIVDGYGAFQPNNKKKVIGLWINGIFQSNPSIIQSFQNLSDDKIKNIEDFNNSEIQQNQDICNSQNQKQNQNKLYYDDQQTLIKYQGEMDKGQKNGQGILYYKNQKIQYVGQFQNDLYHGSGTLYNDNPVFEYQINYQQLGLVQTQGYWRHYEGKFQNGLKNGQGTWYLSNYSEFQGNFENDLPHGEGVISNTNHKELKAKWKHGVLESEL
ncbi:unnamed protein product [Paramecium pentaurelia]|uniref:Protein kinase-like domain n=1 Tax=Paramecium pentaurelia TaxID=43138 RepID=A0A8S1TVH8_9CILI|nr:unnamed protein product [Paramecium pentaurelia]